MDSPVEDLTVGERLLDAINLQIRACEIVGVAGVSGNGQSSLADVMSELRDPMSMGWPQAVPIIDEGVLPASTALPKIVPFQNLDVPLLSEQPFVGVALFSHTSLTYHSYSFTKKTDPDPCYKLSKAPHQPFS